MSKTRILIIEDEAAIAEGIAYNLRREGYEVVRAADGETGLAEARRMRPDLVLLDLMLPGLSGLEVCQALRRESSMPVIMLTARDTETDKVVGLTVGADDYVTKPFSMAELLARVKAVLRRATSSPEAEDRVEAGDVVLDVARHEVLVRGTSVELSPKEFDLLRVLMTNRGRVLTRERLLSRIWGEERYVDERTVDVHIRWLRRKIEQDASEPRLIQTVRGTGYRFGD
jgi:two-component system, OmpR family, response regulator RegX3